MDSIVRNILKLLVASTLLSSAACSPPSTYNPADPTSRDYYEMLLFQCLLQQDPCLPPLAPQKMAGFAANCWLTSTGNVRCAGANGGGQLGYDDTLNVGNGTAGRSLMEIGDVPLGGTATQISVEGGKACALLTTGAVRCWGKANDGELGYNDTLNVGDGTAGRSILDLGDVNIGGIATQVAAGTGHACALLTTGGVRCWGVNAAGQLGYDDTTNVGDGTAGRSIIAMGDVPIGTPAVKITLGENFTCALSAAGGVRCWGDGSVGQLGYNDALNVGDGTAGRSIVNMGDVPIGEPAVDIFAGNTHACALLEGGRVRCWGSGTAGRLGHNAATNIGDGTAGQSIIEIGDITMGGIVTSMSMGQNHSCALMDDKSVRCWGNGSNGRLGYNSSANVGDGVGQTIMEAGAVPIGGADVLQISAAQGSCALLTDGNLRCWGTNGQGQLGYNDTLNVGDGTAGRSIMEMGDVPMGVPLAITAPR